MLIVLKTMPIMVTTSQGKMVDPFPFAAVKIAIELNTLLIQLEYRLKHVNLLDFYWTRNACFVKKTNSS